jgi:hypothetical protein
MLSFSRRLSVGAYVKERFSALKRKGLFNIFPNLERKVIKSATNEEICFFITNQ